MAKHTIPIRTQVEIDGISTPESGEMVLNSDTGKLQIYDGSSWQNYDDAKSILGVTVDDTNITDGFVLSYNSTSGDLEYVDAGNASVNWTSVSSDIIPSDDLTYSLGSSSNQWQDLYVGPGSIYVNNKKVIEDNAGTIRFTTDTDQNLAIETAGTGDISFSADAGNLEFKSTVSILAGKKVISSDGNGISFGNSINFDVGKGIDGTAIISGTIPWDHLDNSIPGTSLAEFAIDADAVSHVILKNIGGTLYVRNQDDNDDANLVVKNLTVNGTTTTVNSETVNIADNIITLNSDVSGTPSQDAGIEVNRGSATNASLIWDEAADTWKIGLSGSESAILVEGDAVGGLWTDADPDIYYDTGNVGIGGSPSHPLHIQSTLGPSGGPPIFAVESSRPVFFMSSTAANYGFNFELNEAGSAKLQKRDAAGNFQDNFMTMEYGDNSVVFPSGNVAIGDISPSYTLDVDGDINLTGDLRQNGSIVSFGGGSSLWTDDGDGSISYSGDVDVTGDVKINGTPASTAMLVQYENTSGEISIDVAYSNVDSRPLYVTSKSRGTLSSREALQADDKIGSLGFKGYDGSAFQLAGIVEAFVDGTPTSGSALPTRLSFVTGTNAGDRQERLQIKNDGVIRFNDAFSFPTSDGTNGQVLKTDGSGNLTWQDDLGGAGSSLWANDGDGSISYTGDVDIIGTSNSAQFNDNGLDLIDGGLYFNGIMTIDANGDLVNSPDVLNMNETITIGDYIDAPIDTDMFGMLVSNALEITSAKATLGSSATTDLTLTLYKNDVSEATITITTGNTISTSTGFPVSYTQDDTIRLESSGGNDGANLYYYLKGKTTSGGPENIFYYSGTNVGLNTTTPASKFSVDGDIEVETVGNGYIVPSPDGTRYRIRVENDGAVVTEAIA